MVGEGEYNLNILKEISVTHSFLDLDESIKDCQNFESYDNCTTRAYRKNAEQKCGCLPQALNSNKKVKRLKDSNRCHVNVYRKLFLRSLAFVLQ